MSELEAAQARIASLEERLAQMEALVEWFKKQLYGSGKSERQDALQKQMQLGIEELQQAREELKKTQQIAYERAAPKKRCLPAERFKHLPVKETVVIEPEEVRRDPELFERIGEERTFEVDLTPPQAFKREIVRPKYRHVLERSRPPVIAPALKRPIEGSYASAGLLAWVLLSKYRDHLPLYRQERMFKRWKVELPRQTMVDWVASASSLLEVIYWKIREGLLGGGYLQADETPIRFLDPDQKKGKAQTGYFWLMGRPGSSVFIHWAPSRGQKVAEELLGSFNGVLQTDGYAGYNPVHGEGTGVVRVACLAHCRRYFAEAMEDDPIRAGFILRLIGNLYHLDKQCERAAVQSQKLRAVRRQQDFGPTLRLLHKAALRLRETVRPASRLGKACSYLLGQWEALLKLCEHGQAHLDNNLIENAVRPTKLGVRNWLFIGAPHAGKRSAVIYTLLLSCQRFDLDPHAYLKDLLQRLPYMSNQGDFDPLLPHNWKPGLPMPGPTRSSEVTQVVTSAVA